jgi:hypothetical protein
MIGWIKWRGGPISEEPSSAGRRWRRKPRELRLLLYLLVLSGVAAWKYVPRPWHPTCTVETAHHVVYSTATLEQTQETAGKLLLLFNAYSNCFGGLPSFNSRHPKLKLKLYQDRDEFRRINPNLGWAEAFYSWPFCQAYFSSKEANPYHWMLHESTHQLNKEVANLKLAKWMEEGLATYFSTSVLSMEGLRLGQIDPGTYPVWWTKLIATAPELSENLKNGSVIPLKVIITNRGGPSMRGHFNLYYVHWWTLTHFLFENAKYREHALQLAEAGGGLEAFERLIGPVDRIQLEWHTYVRELKKQLEDGL